MEFTTLALIEADKAAVLADDKNRLPAEEGKMVVSTDTYAILTVLEELIGELKRK